MQTNPNTSGEQAQEKDKGRHVQTWDFGMMGDFISKKKKKEKRDLFLQTLKDTLSRVSDCIN